MFARLRYEFELRKLQREKIKNDRFFAAKQAEARAKKADSIAMQRLDGEEIFERGTINDKIALLQTEFLRQEAEKYLLPIPSFDADDNKEDTNWQFAPTGPHYQLSESALAELRSAIRKERKERREVWQSWAALVIGIVGALIGLVSALKK